MRPENIDRGDAYLTLDEARELLGVSRMKLYRLIREEALSTYFVPLDRKRRYVKLSEVERLKRAVPVSQAKEAVTV